MNKHEKRCNTVESTKTKRLEVNDVLKGTYWLNSGVSECFKRFISLAKGRAISTSWLTPRTLGLRNSSSRTSFESLTPASAFES